MLDLLGVVAGLEAGFGVGFGGRGDEVFGLWARHGESCVWERNGGGGEVDMVFMVNVRRSSVGNACMSGPRRKYGGGYAFAEMQGRRLR